MRTSEQEGADDTAVKRTSQTILNQRTNKTTIRTRREKLRTEMKMLCGQLPRIRT